VSSSILIGTAGWTDQTLLDAGWYPPQADTPQRRLAYYTTRFPIVEVDSTYYTPLAERTAQLWVARTPDSFVFNIKAFSLLTGHPTRPAAIYKELRPATDKRNVYLNDLPPKVIEEIWERFLSAVDPLVAAGKLGALLFQFPPWFTIRRPNKQYLLEVTRRCAPIRVAVELRHSSWFSDDNLRETLSFFKEHAIPLVCVDMPQGYASSVPPLLETTADFTVIRFHGHSTKWTSKNIHEKFGYLYSYEELASWTPRLRELARQADHVHVIMNNCYADYAVRNAAQLHELLGEAAVAAPGAPSVSRQ